MKMQITVENLTTTKALAILSALETAEALHDTELGINVLPMNQTDIVQAEALAEKLAADAGWDEFAPTDDEMSHFRTTSPTNASDSSTASAAFVGEPPRRRKPRGYLPHPVIGLPLLGSPRRDQLVPISVANSMLGWQTGRLDYMVRTGSVAAVSVPHGAVRYHYLTPQQLEVLRLATAKVQNLNAQNGQYGRKRFSRKFLQQVTHEWQLRHLEAAS